MFDNIEVISAGDRDPDAKGVEGMSASRMRLAAAENDFKTFRSGLPPEVKPAEVSAILRQQLAGFKSAKELEEVGTVLQVGDGIARIYGLSNVGSGELIEFANGLQGIALNLEEDNVGAVLLGRSTDVKEGDTVKRLGRIASVKVGDGMVGRVVDTLGQPIDGKGPIKGELYEMPLERKAPGVIFREPVKEPLQTGIKAIDAINQSPLAPF